MGSFEASANAIRSSANRISEVLGIMLGELAKKHTNDLQAGMVSGHLRDTGALREGVGSEQQGLTARIGMGPRLSDSGVDIAPLADAGTGAWPLGGPDRHLPLGFSDGSLVEQVVDRMKSEIGALVVGVMEAEGETYGG